jgi:aryl-alcohol dehydrogenase-like predicted oxidoreductase
VELGVTFFDTAPAYGESERILGDFLRVLSQQERDRLVIATKVGEHWDSERQTTFVNHESSWVRKSIEQSLAHLGRIDILQIHKASAELLQSASIDQLITITQEYQIPYLGVSVSDLEAFTLALAMLQFDYYQFPYNRQHDDLSAALTALKKQGFGVPIINRPFAMGAMVKDEGMSRDLRQEAIRDAFRFILSATPHGVVLTGTAKLAHLRENLDAFTDVLRDSRAPAEQ